MELVLASLGVGVFGLVVAGSVYQILSGKGLRFGLGSRRASRPAGRVRVASLGTLMMGIGGMLQVAALTGLIAADSEWKVSLFGSLVFFVGAWVAIAVRLRSRSRSNPGPSA